MATTQANNRRDTLAKRYLETRELSNTLIAPLSAEDACVQSMPDASPAKWHIAHTTWFFETFLLKSCESNYRPFHEAFEFLYNSYYNGVGAQYSRPDRGLITRPSLDDILGYRQYVDARMGDLIETLDAGDPAIDLIELGINHEQQHQELLLMDIKHLFSLNPLYPSYASGAPAISAPEPHALGWRTHSEGIGEFGSAGSSFCFDNETPVHKHYLEAFEIADRVVTNGEFLAFIDDGGYQSPLLWLSDGWSVVNEHSWLAPLYWRQVDGVWHEFSLRGLHPLDLSAPVCHVSFYEADAFARWSRARLPSEYEWERVAASRTLNGNFLDLSCLVPKPASIEGSYRQLFGDVWEWTHSAYTPYPGFKTAPGAVGEYNGKFMSNQMVLRGGCCVTPPGHTRVTYRNFFYPHNRWQFAGIRLARDLAR
ncbi:MAG: ergothioneine biosynthesis protein EgtB [Pseudomonadota bacterium]